MNRSTKLATKRGSSGAKPSIILAGIGLLSAICVASIPTVSSASTTHNAGKAPIKAAVKGQKKGNAAISAGFRLPFTNGRITSRFHQGRWHPGIDLAAPTGTPIVATTSGQKVTFAGRRGGYGNAVITRDKNGRTHLYAHLHSISVRSGQTLNQGKKLGTVGSTGFSTGPHLHYEVSNAAGTRVDPAPLLFPATAKINRPRG